MRGEDSGRTHHSQLEENAAYIVKLRNAVDFTPKDTLKVNVFSTASNRQGTKAPLLSYAASMRAADEAARKLLRGDVCVVDHVAPILTPWQSVDVRKERVAKTADKEPESSSSDDSDADSDQESEQEDSFADSDLDRGGLSDVSEHDAESDLESLSESDE